jgi:hypothetical protein
MHVIPFLARLSIVFDPGERWNPQDAAKSTQKITFTELVNMVLGMRGVASPPFQTKHAPNSSGQYIQTISNDAEVKSELKKINC